MKAKIPSQRRRTVPPTEKAPGTVAWTRHDSAGKARTVALSIQTAGELLAEKLPVRKALLHPWLREAESVLLYAPTGVGKSLFALSAAIAIAGGGRFLGWTTEKRADDTEGWRVIYVDGEMHKGDIQARLNGLLAGAEQVDRKRVLANLTILARQAQDGAGGFPSVTDSNGVTFYRELITNSGANVIIFDNLSTLGEFDDENSASSLNEIVQTLLTLKQLGVATVLVHHAGKSGTMRGSSRLAATFEVIINLDVHVPLDKYGQPKPQAFQGASFLTRFEKVRGDQNPNPVCAWLESEARPLANGGPVMRWKYESADGPRLTEIREGLAVGKWRWQKDIAKALGVTPATITRDLDSGVRLGLWTPHWVSKRLKTGGSTDSGETPDDF